MCKKRTPRFSKQISSCDIHTYYQLHCFEMFLVQAFALTEHDAGYLWKSLVVIFGIYFFYLSERIMKLLAGLRKEEKTKLQLNSVVADESGTLVDSHAHTLHSHSHAHPPKST